MVFRTCSSFQYVTASQWQGAKLQIGCFTAAEGLHLLFGSRHLPDRLFYLGTY